MKKIISSFPTWDKHEVKVTKTDIAIQQSNSNMAGCGTHAEKDYDFVKGKKLNSKPIAMHEETIKDFNSQSHNTGIRYYKVADPIKSEEEKEEAQGEPTV